MSTTPTSDFVFPFVLRDADPQQNNDRREVAFIDKGVADYQTLVDGVRTGVEVVLLDAGQDGLAQMAWWAQSHSSYDAIHVLSHGSEGTLRLGRNTITQSSLSDAGVQAELATLGQALTADGDLLVYGCSVAAGEAGQAFIVNLAAVTGADVAGSDDLTGSSRLGGNWSFEGGSGLIQSQTLESHNYESTLVTV